MGKLTDEYRAVLEELNRRGLTLDSETMDPEAFVRDRLGGDPWSKQVEILRAVAEHRHVAVRSCHGAGKDWIGAHIVLWFANRYKSARVITTGPTDRQVRGILWAEIGKAYKKANPPLPGRLLTQEYHINEDNFSIGFATKSSEKQQSRFQGWHCPNMLCLVDEASGVESGIYDEISGILSSENAHLLEIGNPTNPGGEFAAAFKSPGVYKIKISAFDTPNFTAFGITQADIESGEWEKKIAGPLPRPALVTPEWVAKRFRRWTKDSPLYQARVLAEFPSAGVDQLIPLHWIEKAQHDTTIAPSNVAVLGVDVARYGDAFTVITLRRGGVIRNVARYARADTMTTAGYVKLALKETRAEAAIIDVVGLGAGVYDRCREWHLPVHEFNSAAKAKDAEQYGNARAEVYWKLRKAFEAGDVDLDPVDEELGAQLSVMKWKPVNGRIQIESKEDMRRRGVASPDDADAAAMTFWPYSPKVEVLTPNNRVTSDYARGERGKGKGQVRVRW